MTQLWPETLHQLRLFGRRPAAVFFVIAMPLILLFVLTQVFGNEAIEGLGITTAQFYAPSLAVFGVVMATYTYLAISTSTARDLGILKRIRGTPLPPWVYIAARILAVTVIAMVTALLVTALCRSSETVQAVTSATILPLAFISDVFIRPGDKIPGWMQLVADIFPLRHFATGFAHAFDYAYEGNGFAWPGPEEVYSILPHVAVMAAWGLVAAAVAAAFFNWESRPS